MPFPSRASRTKPSRPCIACGPRGWRPEPRDWTPSADCCENSASSFLSVRTRSCRVFGHSSREPTAVPLLLHTTLSAACDEIDAREANMRNVERQLATLASDMADVTLLLTVPGIGLITATALVALVTDIRRFSTGRHFASFLGLTPKEDSSGSRRKLRAISKQGDVYLRMLVTHGARSVLWHAKAAKQPTSLQRWAVQTEQRRGHNVAAVAVANKLARIVWAVWVQQRSFAPDHRPVYPGFDRRSPRDCIECIASWRTGRTGAGQGR